MFGPQKCPSQYNIPFAFTQSEETTENNPFILVRSEDGLEITTELQLQITAAACHIGKEASLWYDAIYWTLKQLNEATLNDLNVTYVLPSTFKPFDKNTSPRVLPKKTVETKLAELSGKHYQSLYVPAIIQEDTNDPCAFMQSTFKCNACEYCALNDDNCKNRWVLDESEKQKIEEYLLQHDNDKKNAQLLVYARSVINVEREQISSRLM